MFKAISLVQNMGKNLINAAMIASRLQPNSFGAIQLPSTVFNPGQVPSLTSSLTTAPVAGNRQSFIGVQHIHYPDGGSRAAYDEWADSFTQ